MAALSTLTVCKMKKNTENSVFMGFSNFKQLVIIGVNEQKMSTNGYGHGMARAASHAGELFHTRDERS